MERSLASGNARKLKFLSGEKRLWQPLKYENDLYLSRPSRWRSFIESPGFYVNCAPGRRSIHKKSSAIASGAA